jgi:hypothetical protein
MNANLDLLHNEARRAIASGENRFRDAAELLAKAARFGATQRQSAKAIGRSQRWVNALLQWRANGYSDAPFEKRKRIQGDTPAIRNKTSRRLMTAEQAQAMTARATAERAQAEAAKARAEAAARMFAPPTKTIPHRARDLLLKALRALASERAAERASAALIVENARARLNLSWDELIVPAGSMSASSGFLDGVWAAGENKHTFAASGDLPPWGAWPSTEATDAAELSDAA